MLYTLNLHNGICHIYLNKAGKRRKSYSDTCLNGKEDFIQDFAVGVKTIPMGREISLNSEYNNKWGFTAKEQRGEVSG